jgi:hypothetical protein
VWPEIRILFALVSDADAFRRVHPSRAAISGTKVARPEAPAGPWKAVPAPLFLHEPLQVHLVGVAGIYVAGVVKADALQGAEIDGPVAGHRASIEPLKSKLVWRALSKFLPLTGKGRS